MRAGLGRFAGPSVKLFCSLSILSSSSTSVIRAGTGGCVSSSGGAPTSNPELPGLKYCKSRSLSENDRGIDLQGRGRSWSNSCWATLQVRVLTFLPEDRRSPLRSGLGTFVSIRGTRVGRSNVEGFGTGNCTPRSALVIIFGCLPEFVVRSRALRAASTNRRSLNGCFLAPASKQQSSGTADLPSTNRLPKPTKRILRDKKGY